MGRLYCEKLPNCHLVLVYDAAYEVDADRPEAFVSVTSDFIQRMKPSWLAGERADPSLGQRRRALLPPSGPRACHH